MANKLTLHEAIIEVLKNKPDKKANISEIAKEINDRKLYTRGDNKPLPAYQVMMRTKLAKRKYHHLFEYIEPNMVKLREQ